MCGTDVEDVRILASLIGVLEARRGECARIQLLNLLSEISVRHVRRAGILPRG